MNQECLVCRLCWFLPHCHLHQRADEHRNSLSSTGKHFRDKHSLAPKDLAKNFCVLMDCTNKFDCLIYEVFFYSRTETCNRNLIVRRLLISSSFFFRLLIRLPCFFLLPVYTLDSFCTPHIRYIYIHCFTFYHPLDNDRSMVETSSFCLAVLMLNSKLIS